MQKTNIIPLNNIPQPWRDTIGRLQNKVVVLPSEPSEDEQMNLWRVGIMLDIALHWVVRNELNTKHKIPHSRKLTKVIKPLGLLVTCYLRLCRKAYENSKAGTLPYQNAAGWFEAIYQEIWLNSLDTSLYVDGKTKKLKERRDTLHALQEATNNPVDNNTSPHEYQLIEVCLHLKEHLCGEEIDVFEENYWKPYLRAYSAWITAFDGSEWSTVRMEDGNLLVQQGRGSGRPRIRIRTDFLERLPDENFSF
jgi:hypothetical protein